MCLEADPHAVCCSPWLPVQVYPEGARQATLLTDAAMRAGFSGGLVVDFPHSTRAKKYFLVRRLRAALPWNCAGRL